MVLTEHRQDVVFECAAVPVTVVQSVKVVRHGGQIVTIALAEEAAPINVTSLVQKEITLSGAYAIRMILKKQLLLLRVGRYPWSLLLQMYSRLRKLKMDLTGSEIQKAV